LEEKKLTKSKSVCGHPSKQIGSGNVSFWFPELSLKIRETIPEHSPYFIKMEPKNNLHGTFL